MAMSVITRWYYLCLTPKTCKKHRGIEAWLRQCGSDEDTKLVTEVRRLQLRMAHTFLNVLLGPLFWHHFLESHVAFPFFFVCYKWMRCQVFGLNMEDVIFLKDIPSAENLFFDVFGGDLTQWWVGDSGENHGILHHFSWIQWQRVEWKGARKFSLRSSPLKLVSCKLYSRNGQEHIFKKKTAIRNDPISRGIAKFINLYWEMVYGSGYRTSKTNSHRWWNCQVGWDWKWYHADLSERPGADFAEELQMTRWLCDLFCEDFPKKSSGIWFGGLDCPFWKTWVLC